MFSWEDVEFNLGGKVKSVLVVVLASLLVTQQGIAGGRESDAVSSAAVNSTVWEDNPIDDYFAGTEGAVNAAMPDVLYANIYLDSWEKELQHAYNILGEELGEGYVKEYAREAGEKFRQFAGAQSWLESYLQNSAHEETQNEGGETAAAGEAGALGAAKAYSQVQLTRRITLRIYGLLKEYGRKDKTYSGREGVFRFRQQEAEEALLECGLLAR